MITSVCVQCGAEFSREPHRILAQGQRYCSLKCNYISKRRTAEQTFARFVCKASDPDACWEWAGGTTVSGYGLVQQIDTPTTTAHRVSYQIHKGPIPKGMFVLHRCDNPPCCNPAHLFLGTHAENMADMATKGRRAIKLSKETVTAIRASSASSRALGREHGVSKTTIRRIQLGKAWSSNP